MIFFGEELKDKEQRFLPLLSKPATTILSSP
jgi:hypothetical protein